MDPSGRLLDIVVYITMFGRTVPRLAPRGTRMYLRQSTMRQLVAQPIFKSVFLTLVLGSATIDLMSKRKELEALETTYKSKIMILEDLAGKLERGENVDITKELKLANSLTRAKYNSVTDIHFDELLEKFVSELMEEPKEKSSTNEIRDVDSKDIKVQQILNDNPKGQELAKKVDTSKFL